MFYFLQFTSIAQKLVWSRPGLDVDEMLTTLICNTVLELHLMIIPSGTAQPHFYVVVLEDEARVGARRNGVWR